MRKIYGLKLISIFVVLIMASCAGQATPSATPGIELNKLTPTKRVVRVEAERVELHYQNESYWEEGQYSVILENKAEFSSDLITKFVEDVSKHGDKREEVVNASVEFNAGKESTILKCDIHGAISRSGDRYAATFFWLLRPLGLDFINDDFEESERGLCWQGSVSDVPTTITVELPTIDESVYEAWAKPIGHCHAHAWWEMGQE